MNLTPPSTTDRNFPICTTPKFYHANPSRPKIRPSQQNESDLLAFTEVLSGPVLDATDAKPCPFALVLQAKAIHCIHLNCSAHLGGDGQHLPVALIKDNSNEYTMTYLYHFRRNFAHAGHYLGSCTDLYALRCPPSERPGSRCYRWAKERESSFGSSDVEGWPAA